MRLLIWNVQFGKHDGSIQHLDELIANRSCDVACVTETTLKYLAGRGNVLRSIGNYGYHDFSGFRQKVSLWSRHPWSEMDFEGDKNLPPGRFLSGVTLGVRFVGVCIPWPMAHVTTGTKSKARWEDHKIYLRALKSILDLYSDSQFPTCIFGDFNQPIPATWNREVFPQLMETIGTNFKIWTGGISDAKGKPLVDHVAVSNGGSFTVEEVIERFDNHGIELSDHAGFIGTLATPESNRLLH
jgi:hypothetical protein